MTATSIIKYCMCPLSWKNMTKLAFKFRARLIGDALHPPIYRLSRIHTGFAHQIKIKIARLQIKIGRKRLLLDIQRFDQVRGHDDNEFRLIFLKAGTPE